MAALAITSPLPQFFGLDGSPLDGGRVYFGAVGQNPETNPATVYWDAAATQPVAQPVLTVNGYIVRGSSTAGLPAPVYALASFSMTVRDKRGRLVLSVPDSSAWNVADAVRALQADLANTSDATKGDALIGVKRTDIASAVALTLHDWHQAARVNVRQVGVTGDGSTDDAALLNTLGALGIPLYIPYTSTGYKIASPVTFACDVYCEGFFTPTTAIGALTNDYQRFAIILPSAGYGPKRRYYGLRVAGSVALRAANVSGIRNDCENSLMERCTVYQLNYGIVVRSYSITVAQCAAFQCNTNLSAYARSFSLEINALTIWGGNYDSAVNCAMNIGDTSWSDAMAPNTSHGVHIIIGGGINIDGHELRIDNCSNVEIALYSEGSTSNTAIRLGGAADGSLRNVRIRPCYFSNLDYAIRCYSGIEGLTVEESFYTNVRRSALYITTDIYHFEYRRGTNVGSFAQGQEVHTGFRSLPLASVTFGNVTIPHQGIYRGRQTLLEDGGIWYPAGLLQSGSTIKSNQASSAARYYTSPVTGKAGTVSGSVFTFTTASDAKSFNGGDAIVTAPAGATYVRSVDYAAGTMVIDGGVTAAGAATVSQQAVVFASHTTTYSGAAPSSGAWLRGDIADNGVPAVGSPKRWLCTVSGTPGTWVSEGNL